MAYCPTITLTRNHKTRIRLPQKPTATALEVVGETGFCLWELNRLGWIQPLRKRVGMGDDDEAGALGSELGDGGFGDGAGGRVEAGVELVEEGEGGFEEDELEEFGALLFSTGHGEVEGLLGEVFWEIEFGERFTDHPLSVGDLGNAAHCFKAGSSDGAEGNAVDGWGFLVSEEETGARNGIGRIRPIGLIPKKDVSPGDLHAWQAHDCGK